MPRTCPVRESRRMAIVRSLSPSSVTVPAGPESVILASAPAHDDCTGRVKAKAERPPPSATSGIAKPSEKSSAPAADSPTMR